MMGRESIEEQVLSYMASGATSLEGNLVLSMKNLSAHPFLPNNATSIVLGTYTRDKFHIKINEQKYTL